MSDCPAVCVPIVVIHTHPEEVTSDLSSRHPSLSCYLFDWSDAVDPLRQSILQDLLRRINAEIIIGTDLVGQSNGISSYFDLCGH